MTTQLPAAVLWDMDGTLVDTEPYWISTEIDLVAEHGGEWTHEDALTVVGAGLWETAEKLRERGVDMSVDEIVATLTATVSAKIESEGVPFRPGALELLTELRESGVPTALVTMSIASMAELVVSKIPFAAFDLLVTGDAVTHAKPHPEPYLTAAARLGVNPADCVALEDSNPGIRSAAAAGTIAVAIPHATEIAPDPSYTLLPGLEGIGLAELRALAQERRAQPSARP